MWGLLGRFPFLGYVALAGWLAAGTAGWLYKEQVEYTGRVISGCETDIYRGALEQAVESMKRQSEIHQEWRVRMQEQIAAENVARIRAEAITGEAMRQLHDAQRALKEADQDACLNDTVDPDIIASLQ
jgi:hypothetical protein